MRAAPLQSWAMILGMVYLVYALVQISTAFMDDEDE